MRVIINLQRGRLRRSFRFSTAAADEDAIAAAVWRRLIETVPDHHLLTSVEMLARAAARIIRAEQGLRGARANVFMRGVGYRYAVTLKEDEDN